MCLLWLTFRKLYLFSFYFISWLLFIQLLLPFLAFAVVPSIALRYATLSLLPTSHFTHCSVCWAITHWENSWSTGCPEHDHPLPKLLLVLNFAKLWITYSHHEVSRAPILRLMWWATRMIEVLVHILFQFSFFSLPLLICTRLSR